MCPARGGPQCPSPCNAFCRLKACRKNHLESRLHNDGAQFSFATIFFLHLSGAHHPLDKPHPFLGTRHFGSSRNKVWPSVALIVPCKGSEILANGCESVAVDHNSLFFALTASITRQSSTQIMGCQIRRNPLHSILSIFDKIVSLFGKINHFLQLRAILVQRHSHLMDLIQSSLVKDACAARSAV